MRYIWLRNFEGTGRSARVSLEAIIQRNNRPIAETTKGKIGRRIQKPIKRRSAADVVGKVEE
jgi:hypothetical protein